VSNLPYTIHDDFLHKADFLKLKELILDNDNFPWYLKENVSGLDTDEGKDYYFTHLFVKEFESNSSYSQDLRLIVDKAQMKNVFRIKANLYPATDILYTHSNHRDFTFNNKAAIFYLNTCNGFTILQDKYKIESIENRLLMFNGQDLHCSTNCTDKLYRANINFNYVDDSELNNVRI